MRHVHVGWERILAHWFAQGGREPWHWRTSSGKPRCVACGEPLVEGGVALHVGARRWVHACDDHQASVRAELERAGRRHDLVAP